MREILFRGKRVDNGKWVYGYYVKATHHWHTHGIHEDWIATDTVQNGGWCNVRGKYAVDPETLGQYTGLTDKNGKKIFEGDIVKYGWGEVGIVEFGKGTFDSGCYCYYGWHTKDKYGRIDHAELYIYEDDEYGCYESYEVIGNIHDNPELLKGE